MTDLWNGRRLGVVGAGNMAEAMVRGALAAGLLTPDRITASDPDAARRGVFQALGCGTESDGRQAARCDAVLLAVKPQVMKDVLSNVGALMRPGALAISIAAGVDTTTIESYLPAGVALVRAMPNLPLVAGRGMTALARGRGADDAAMRLAISLFTAAGAALELDESRINAVTALSGSGPAYVFKLAEAMAAAGEGLGLPKEVALTLTIETIRGAAAMLEREGVPAELRRRVTSPGGTTAAAIKTMDDGGFDSLVRGAVDAAFRRGGELGAK